VCDVISYLIYVADLWIIVHTAGFNDLGEIDRNLAA